VPTKSFAERITLDGAGVGSSSPLLLLPHDVTQINAANNMAKMVESFFIFYVSFC
jgi:hypothetical protein